MHIHRFPNTRTVIAFLYALSCLSLSNICLRICVGVSGNEASLASLNLGYCTVYIMFQLIYVNFRARSLSLSLMHTLQKHAHTHFSLYFYMHIHMHMHTHHTYTHQLQQSAQPQPKSMNHAVAVIWNICKRVFPMHTRCLFELLNTF